jgi:thermitase
MEYRTTFHSGALVLTSALLFAACGQAPSQETERAQPFTYTLPVTVNAGATRASVEAQYSGDVIVWQPEAGFAVLGLREPPRSGTLQALGLGEAAELEDNANALDAGGATSAWNGDGVAGSGRAYLWSGGRAYLWSGGRAYLWSGGNGVLGGVPENAPAWQRTGLKQAWAAAPRLGEGVRVAVIDTGLDLQHEIFQGSLVPESDRWDFVGNDPTPQEEGTFDDDAYGHGTNVAGIILQVAPRAQIMPLRALRPNGSGDVTAVAQAIDWAVSHGAQVINLSLGSVKKTGVLKQMIKYATEQGVYVISSSGNSGDKQITYPARYGHEGGKLGGLSLSVGSVDAADRKSTFSTYGKELEVVAPGERVYGPVPGNLLSYWSGTSMASPMASGALALALGQPLTVKREDLAKELQKSGDDINALNEQYKQEVGRRLNIGLFVRSVVQP